MRHQLTRQEARKGGKANAWRQCVYCSRFISNADFNKGRASTNFWHSYDHWTEDVVENLEAFHKACKRKATRK